MDTTEIESHNIKTRRKRFRSLMLDTEKARDTSNPIGIVSGIAAHSNAVGIAEAAVRIRKPPHGQVPH